MSEVPVERRELVVDAKPAPGDASAGSGSAIAPVAVPVLAAGAVAKLVSPALGLAILGGTVAIALARRKPREGRFVLRAADGVLEVTRERPRAAAVQLPLEEIDDVVLDRETQAAGNRGGATVERVRIALVRRGADAPVVLPEERITPLEAQEWLAKVRVFLRGSGWVPGDERRVEE